MTDHIQYRTDHSIGRITLNRPQALNALSLDMVRSLSDTLRAWQYDGAISAVFIDSSSPKAFCAGGDIRFFHQVGTKNPQGGSALLEDFFTEEYALNYLTHFYSKPIITLLDGIVMGGGMGLAQSGPQCRLAVVTERTKMAMPEVNIGLFPDVGGTYFLSRTIGQTGTFLALTGSTINAADALYCGLADVFVPVSGLDEMRNFVNRFDGADMRGALRDFSSAFTAQCDLSKSTLARDQATIDRHFGFDSITAIIASLTGDTEPFAQDALYAMQHRSPTMLCVTLEALRRGATMSLAECLRMERTMVRRTFEHGEVLEGIRAAVVDKDQRPAWNPPQLQDVQSERVAKFFESAWPQHAHPLRELT